MLEFKQNDTTKNIILTLTELVTPGLDANYLFIFTHVVTRAVVAFVLLDADDISPYKDRYNSFNINPSVLFTGQMPGEWHYTIYEQESTSNLDVALTGEAIEYGKLILESATEFEFDKYELPTSFKTYNG